MSNQPTPELPRQILALAEKSGARISGKPDGSEPIEVIFPIPAWRAFSATIGQHISLRAELVHFLAEWEQVLPADAREALRAIVDQSPSP